MTAQQFYQKWRKKILCHRIGYIEFEPAEAFEFAEAYAAERVKAAESKCPTCGTDSWEPGVCSNTWHPGWRVRSLPNKLAERVKELEAELAKMRAQCGEENKP